MPPSHAVMDGAVISGLGSSMAGAAGSGGDWATLVPL